MPSAVIHGVGFDRYAKALVMTLRLGYTHRASAVAALDALDRMREEEPEQLDSRLSTLLPPLQGYLTLAADSDSDGNKPGGAAGRGAGSATSYSVTEARDVALYEKSLANERKRQQQAQAPSLGMTASDGGGGGGGGGDAVNGEASDSSTTTATPDGMEQLQHRIVRFLGHLGGRSHHLLKPLREVLQEGRGLAWAPSLPPSAISLEIDLRTSTAANAKPLLLRVDALLPRVVELALRSSDRETKHASCELLHALACSVCGLESQHRRSFAEVYDCLLYTSPSPRDRG